MSITRRDALIKGVLLAVCATGLPAQGLAAGDEAAAAAYLGVRDYAGVRALAETLARGTFKAPPRIPDRFTKMDRDAYFAIHSGRKSRLWAGGDSPFEVGMFHAGGLFQYPVRIFEIVGGETKAIGFDPARFTYGDVRPTVDEEDALGYAGFRLYGRLNWDRDLASFLGASYFRAVGGELQYGLSARGLAVDTARFGSEEFPMFRALWLHRPKQDDGSLTVLALLDSASTAGAYRFVIEPGRTTVIDVDTAIFPRTRLDSAGIAPITSMYLHGENDYRQRDDYRPEVHDSDGLCMLTGAGEWIWRPLHNPAKPHVNAFTDNNPRGFGLLQRDRNFDHYQDDRIFFERRPNLWIEPKGDWGPGRIELVELPARDEDDDNIVAYWRPDQPPQPDKPAELSYRMHWGTAMPDRLPAPARAVATRIGIPEVPWAERDRKNRTFVVDFVGGDLMMLDAAAPVRPVITVNTGKIARPVARRIQEHAGWRVTFDLLTEGAAMVDLRMFLEHRGGALSETWTYQWLASDL
ncbi:periplasmic glucan biosynthesis protein, putative [alpha proteobacterium BAL199]|nr:periplasmic glucan biosynthesis protein, putative [alpha proteobacterium BAL199]